MAVERIEIPKYATRATPDGQWYEVPTGEIEVFYRRSGPTPAGKCRPRPNSKGRRGRRNHRR